MDVNEIMKRVITDDRKTINRILLKYIVLDNAYDNREVIKQILTKKFKLSDIDIKEAMACLTSINRIFVDPIYPPTDDDIPFSEIRTENLDRVLPDWESMEIVDECAEIEDEATRSECMEVQRMTIVVGLYYYYACNIPGEPNRSPVAVAKIMV